MNSASRSTCVGGYVLLFVGLLSTVGILGGFRLIRLVGQASLASPVAIVYSEVQGYRVMALRARVSLTLDDGSTTTFVLDRERYNEIATQENFFNRHLTVLGYVAAIELLLKPEDVPRRTAIIRQGFCSGGPLSRYLHLEHPVQRVRISMEGDAPEKLVQRELEVVCSE